MTEDRDAIFPSKPRLIFILALLAGAIYIAYEVSDTSPTAPMPALADRQSIAPSRATPKATSRDQQIADDMSVIHRQATEAAELKRPVPDPAVVGKDAFVQGSNLNTAFYEADFSRRVKRLEAKYGLTANELTAISERVKTRGWGR